MHIRCKKVISAILIATILFLAACSAAQQPPPIVEETPPPQTSEEAAIAPEDLAEVEPIEPAEPEEVETIEEIEEPTVLPRGDTEFERFIFSYIDGIAEQGFRGTAISVFTRDEIILEFTYGYKNTAEEIPIDNETVFEWGSITKLLTWISVLQLYEQDRLDIHADLFTYLPREDFPNIIYPITLYHLMHHSAGFIGYWGIDVAMINVILPGSPIPPLENALRRISTLEALIQQSKPGERFFYSNAYGPSLAAYVVQRVSGLPFYQYVHNNIFEPLGMRYTALKSDLSDNLLLLEQREKIVSYGHDGLPITTRRYFALYPPAHATGRLSDMVIFAQALFLGENGESALFENPETHFKIFPTLNFIQNAETDEVAEGIIFHYGFMIFGDRNLYSNRFAFRDSSERIIGHTGGTVGFRSILWIDIDRGIGMVMSENTNFGLSAAESFYADIAEVILRA